MMLSLVAFVGSFIGIAPYQTSAAGEVQLAAGEGHTCMLTNGNRPDCYRSDSGPDRQEPT